MNDRTPTEARSNSERLLAKGDRLAYDAPDDAETAPPPVDWAHRAARGIICDLCDRKAIKWGFENVDEEIRAEIVGAMSDIIRAASPPAPAAEPVAFAYRNWRGEVSERHVRIIGIRFGSSEWHPEPQLLLRAFDLDKGEEREFAVNDIGPHPLDAAAIRAEARREALEEAAAWHDDQAALHDAQGEACGTGSDGWKRHTVAAADHRRSAASVRALADKGEVE